MFQADLLLAPVNVQIVPRLGSRKLNSVTPIMVERFLDELEPDAVDALNRFYELKTTYGPEQDTVTPTAKECERATSEAEFFLVVVPGLAADSNPVSRLVPDPLHRLRIRPNGNVMLTGIKQSGSLIVEFGAREEPEPS